MPARRRRAVDGVRIGVVTLETAHDLVPGNVQHASSFPFAVAYAVVRDVPFALIARGDPAALPPILEAAQTLQRQGVDIITGACGSFAHYQREVADALDVPVCLSILVQAPFLLSLLPPKRKLAVMFARTAAFTALARAQCSIGEDALGRIVAIGADPLESSAPIFDSEKPLDDAGLRREVVSLSLRTCAEDPAIGAWLIQCSDLPPYAGDIRRATGLPVWDMTLLIEHLYGAAARRDYSAPAGEAARFLKGPLT